jgi:hypothetical protein
LFFKVIPYVVVGLLFGSMAVAAYLRKARPDLYERIGSTVFDDAPSDLSVETRS